MPTPMYDNKWLASRKPGKDYTVDILKNANSGDIPMPGSGGDPLAEAKAFLAKPDVTKQNVLTPQDNADLKSRLDWNSQNNDMAADIAQKRKGTGRRITEGLSSAGDLASTGSIAALPLSLIGAPEPSAALAALGGVLHTPDRLRRAYAPQDGETAPGPGEAALAGLELLPGAGMLGHLGQGVEEASQVAQGAERFAGVRPRIRIPEGPSPFEYENAPTGINPNFQHATVAQDAARTAKLADRSTGLTSAALRRGTAAGLPAPTEDAWSALGNLNRRSEGFDPAMAATNRRSTLDFVGQGGRTPLPERVPSALPLQGQADAILEQAPNPIVDLSEDINRLSPLDRAARQSRAKERFGRVFSQ